MMLLYYHWIRNLIPLIEVTHCRSLLYSRATSTWMLFFFNFTHDLNTSWAPRENWKTRRPCWPHTCTHDAHSTDRECAYRASNPFWKRCGRRNFNQNRTGIILLIWLVYYTRAMSNGGAAREQVLQPYVIRIVKIRHKSFRSALDSIRIYNIRARHTRIRYAYIVMCTLAPPPLKCIYCSATREPRRGGQSVGRVRVRLVTRPRPFWAHWGCFLFLFFFLVRFVLLAADRNRVPIHAPSPHELARSISY